LIPPRPRSTLFPYTTLFRSDRARGQSCARVLLRKRLVGRQEADLVHQIGRIARPPFRHRAAEEHADAARAVDRCHAADLGISRVDRKSTRLNSSHVAISYAV